MRRHIALTLGFGLAYLVIGTTLFLRGLDIITLRWTHLGPVLLVLFGAALVVGGILAERLRHTPAFAQPAAYPWPRDLGPRDLGPRDLGPLEAGPGDAGPPDGGLDGSGGPSPR